jgi:hypothetical protein
MRLILNILTVLLLCGLIASDSNNQTTNPNVWNFQIARKVIAAFQYNGMGMSIWEDQGVENTSVVTARQFYVTPITEFLPNSSKCEYNDLTGAYFVSYEIQLWNDRLQQAGMGRLRQMQINVQPEQVQPLPFYQVRVVWNNAQENLQKASLSTTWENNLQQQSIRRFKIITDDKETCDRLGNTLQNKPEFFTDSIALQYSLSAASTATRILTVKTEHFLNSQLMAALKTMDVQSPERYLTANDTNKLTLQIMDNVFASQVVDGDYVPDTDQLTIKDLINSCLQIQNVDVGNFTSKMWDSVFWDPVYARPDEISSYLNKVLDINSGNHTVSKSNSYTDKTDGGIDIGIKGLFSIGGHGGGDSSKSATYSELYEWMLQHNYDVEIKGQLFVPKSLSLKRVNLDVLNRQETIFTKSVQMHHVDAPGTLTVTVGSQSVVESEDIKNLRQNMDGVMNRLNALEPRTGKLEGRTGILEGRIGIVEPQVANTVTKENQLDAKIENVRVSLSNALGAKISACQLCITPGPNPNGGSGAMCTNLSNNPSYVGGHYCTGQGCSYTIQCVH